MTGKPAKSPADSGWRTMNLAKSTLGDISPDTSPQTPASNMRRELGADAPSVLDDGMTEPDSSVNTSCESSRAPEMQHITASLSAISSGIRQYEELVKINSLKQAAHEARQQAAEVLRTATCTAEADVKGAAANDSTELVAEAATWKGQCDRWSKALDKFKKAQESAANLTAKADELELAAQRQVEVLKETVDKFAEQMKGTIDAAATE